jgi:hypothetical protein
VGTTPSNSTGTGTNLQPGGHLAEIARTGAWHTVKRYGGGGCADAAHVGQARSGRAPDDRTHH